MSLIENECKKPYRYNNNSNNILNFTKGKNKASLWEMCPNTEFFLVRIQSEWEKIRRKKTLYLDIFYAVHLDECVKPPLAIKLFYLSQSKSLLFSFLSIWISNVKASSFLIFIISVSQFSVLENPDLLWAFHFRIKDG